ncbi:hypothetical protein [Burkholderia sp. BCC0322]|nr:hypothetical protein [Burkholderia sp. BCC0322]
MLSFKELIEVGQDAAGIIEENNKIAKGFFTVGIQSCLVTVYFFKKATVLIHDSGQLKMTEILALVKKYGTVGKLIIAWGSKVSPRHKERLQTLIKFVALRQKNQLEQVQVPHNDFAFICDTSGKYEVIPNSIPAEAPRIPDKEKRQAVCEVNNFFLEPNAQSLSLDIQYREGEYAPVRSLDKPLGELLKTVEEQPKFFFRNIAVLHGAYKQGLLTLPPTLEKVAALYDVDRLRYQERLSPQDEANEEIEFKAYIDSLAQAN